MSASDVGPNKPFRVYSAKTLGAAIRHFRSAAHVSQTELAQRTGIPRNYVNALETGHDTEYINRLLTVLRELGVRFTLDQGGS